MKLNFSSLLLIILLTVNCKGQVSSITETLPATTFAEKIKTTPNTPIIDVRTPEEYLSQHIENAENINWNSDNFNIQIQKLDKTKPVFVYCMSGGRSKKAAAKLEELGFSKIYDLEGGILKWNSAGMNTPSDKTIGVSSKEYEELLLSDKKVLVNFYAEWCAPCKKMAPYIKKMQSEIVDNVVIIRLNADKNKTIIKELKIDELPTLILYENKEIKWKHSGFISEEDLKKQLQ